MSPAFCELTCSSGEQDYEGPGVQATAPTSLPISGLLRVKGEMRILLTCASSQHAFIFI
ncbi:hypothetical protein ASZ90_009514 [hydrocarbon metagenome]|uniref:Uncharacterized protein n=1 Tax=hydrocarbon metagenome TaxID=938273 RepID=A0A0W8FIS3_9ZZZZ